MQLHMSLWRKYRSYEQRKAAFAELSTVSSLPCSPKLSPHRITPRKSVRCTFTDMYHRPNLFTGDNNSRSARAESFSNGDLSGSVRNAQSASNATLEPSV